MLMLASELDDLGKRHRTAIEELISFDVVERLSAIAVPTLVMCGGRDPLVPCEQCQSPGRIPQATLEIFEWSGHDLEPAPLGAVVRRFITERVTR